MTKSQEWRGKKMKYTDRFIFRVDENMAETMKKIAAEHDITVSMVLRLLLKKAVEQVTTEGLTLFSPDVNKERPE